MQQRIIRFVNAATAPEECVFDGAGLAMFRKGPGDMWYLHFLNQRRYRAGELPQVQDMLARNPCPVLIQNYKWYFMYIDDFAFIGSRYVSFHQVLWILGCRLPATAPGLYPFDIHRDGFYRVTADPPGPLRRLNLDGGAVDARPVFLRRGSHTLEVSQPGDPVQILWTNPDRTPDVPVPDVSQPVFHNWY